MAEDTMLVRAAIRDELTGPLEGIRDELRRVAKETDNVGRKANIGARGFDRMASGAGRFVKAGIGAAARVAATGIAALTAAAVVGSVKVLQLASDAAETASAFGTVFKGVSGDVAGYIRRMHQQFGIATAELQRAATTFGVFGKAAGVSRKDLGGFTKDLVSAGLDLSSFYNADPTEVFQALRSGLAGEAEPLRKFGIFLSDAAMKAEAATIGLTGELSESQKVMVRQRIIMKSLGDAQGDLARTQDGLANTTRSIKGRITELATAMGDRLRPAAERLAGVVDEKLRRGMANLPAHLDRVEAATGALFNAWKAGGIDAAVGKVDELTGSGGKLADAWAEAKSIAADLATLVTGVLVPSFNDAAGATGGLSSPLGLLRRMLGWAADNTGLVRAALTALIVTLTAAKVITLGVATATKVKAVADRIALINLKAHTVGTKTHLVVSKAARVGTLLWAGAQRVLNLAMRANPIGLVVTAVGLLIAGLVTAYKKSDTFREAVHTLWDWLKKFVGFTPLGFLVKNFDKVKEAIEPVLDLVRELWDKLANSTVGKAVGKVLGGLGDTATSRARGGNLGSTLATHAAVTAATGARPTITNTLIGGGGMGRGSGDHQRGRAVDLQGKGLARYGAHMRAIGGYAAFHGSGSGRHLHAVPPAAGDTGRSMAARVRPRAGGTGGGTTIEAGAVTVTVTNPTANVDVETAVTTALESWLRDREERA